MSSTNATTPLWPHQEQALGQIATDMADGYQSVVNAAPTGAGKSRIMFELLEWGYPVALYTDRRFLMEQLAQGLRDDRFSFGIRAAGWDVNVMPDIQLCMVQTEYSRVVEKEERDHHKAKIVLLDEAHRIRAEMAQSLLDLHKQDGAFICGFTATPIGLEGVYEKLNVLATNSECRRIGALLPAKTYSPSMPDLRDIEPKRRVTGEYPTEELAKKYARPEIFGSVYHHWRRLNPNGYPTLLFGPDVDGSHWFHDQFHAKGVSCAHIDGERVIVNGEEYESTSEVRAQLMADYESGEIEMVCNRFVLREGIDAPFIGHTIFATAFGSLQAYIQAGGRVLRAHPSMDHVVVQDHGGNALRHGSLNADRHWRLSDTEPVLRKQREQNMREGQEPEPIVCPNCFKERQRGKECPECRYRSSKRSRAVIQRNGTLKEIKGDFYRPRREHRDPSAFEDWRRCVFRCGNAKRPMSFNQAAGLFAREHGGLRPNKEWPLVPQSEVDGMRRITKEALSELGKADRAKREQKSTGLFEESRA